MKDHTIDIVDKENLCISCGICSAVCPLTCISYELKNDGMYHPVIAADCISCGKCYRFCPGKGVDYKLLQKITDADFDNPYIGKVKKCFTAYSCDDNLLRSSTSGGVVTALIRDLLYRGEFDCAFTVQSNSANELIETKRVTIGDDFLRGTKSRYIPVMQAEAIRYMLTHKNEKIIFVGISCFVESLIYIIHKYSLNRKNYLIIGLFCDKTMSYNVCNYFREYSPNCKELSEIHFRTKEKFKWPGGVCLFYKDGTKELIPSYERMMVKDYFIPERCLYCLDKLNQFADISVGDNYTKKNTYEYGSSSVIIRTIQGEKCFNKNLFQLFDCDIVEIVSSQHIYDKQYNRVYQELKNSHILCVNNDFPFQVDKYQAQERYNEAIQKCILGLNNDMVQIKALVAKERKKRKEAYKENLWKRIFSKIKRFIGGVKLFL